MKPKRVKILGVPLDCVNMDTALLYADSVIKEKRSAAVLAMNPEKVIRCLDNIEFHKNILAADLLIPDGIGVVLAARLLGERNLSRVPGSEFMPNLCKIAAEKGYTVFLYGAAPDVNETAVAVLRKRYPAIKIVGSQHGYLVAEKMDDFVDRLAALAPDILFVALGSPAQEEWIMEYLSRTGVKICQGVGGTFDVISGNVRRAPGIFRAMHLEWLYRLLAQPSRIFRQTALPRFVWKFALSLFSRKSANYN